MANLINDPEYTTAVDAKATSKNAAFIALTDGDVNYYITKAQYAIDAYIGSYGTKFDVDQAWIFPLYDETDPLVPYLPLDIQIATVYAAEYQYVIRNASQSSTSVIEERMGPRTIKYGQSKTNNPVLDSLPDNALVILDQYRNPFTKQIV